MKEKEAKAKQEPKEKKRLSSFSIIIILFIYVAVTWFIPEVSNAKLSDILMAPVNGFSDSMEVCIFILILGGFLAVVTKTGALEMVLLFW